MNIIDQALTKLPFELKQIVLNFVGNPHGFKLLDADAEHKCVKYHHGQSWFDGPAANVRYKWFIWGVLKQTERHVYGEDEYGNSKIRTLFLKQWASSKRGKVCGLIKRPMELVKHGQTLTHYIDHTLRVEPSRRVYHLNDLTDNDFACVETLFQKIN